MKTPSYLPLLVLLAALPAAAAPKAGERCDTAFLEKVANDFRAGGTVPDARIVDQVVEGINRPVLKLMDPGTCDAGTWLFIAGSLSNPDAKKYWNSTNAGRQAELVLVADDFYKAIDPKIAEVLAAADEVIATGVELGVVTTAAMTKSQADFLKEKSGGPMAAAAPKVVTFPSPAGAGTVGRESLGAALRKVLDENGKEGGTAVKRFRLAVLALGREIAVRGQGNAAVVKRTGAALPNVKDFLAGLPSPITPQAFAKENAADPKFKGALAALVGTGVVPLDGPEPKDSFLFGLDTGLNNLIGIRSAQIDQIAAAAKPRLGGKTITQIEVAGRTESESGKQPANSLSAAVVKRLAESPEYMKLDALYENQKNAPGGAEWAKRPEAEAMFAARENILKAAKSAKVETDAQGNKSVVFTQGGKKVELTSIVPSSVENDAETRNDVAGMISRFILDGARGDAKYRAVVAAFSMGEPGETLDTGMTEEEAKLARTSPALDAVKKRAQGTNSLADIARNDFERYAQRERARAAAVATENQRKRKQIEAKRDADVRAADVDCKAAIAKVDAACKKALSDINAVKKDDFQSKESFDAERQEARDAAAAQCKASKTEAAAACQTKKDAIVAAAAAELVSHDEAAKANNAETVNADANLALKESFKSAVVATVAALRTEYSTADSSRQKKLVKDAELSGSSARLTIFVGFWFDQHWPPENADKQGAAALACAKSLGLGDESAAPSFHNPENTDTVAERCGIHAALTKYVKEAKGTIK